MAPFRPIRGHPSKAEFMSQADPQFRCLRPGSTRRLDQDCRPKYLLQFPGRFSPPTSPCLGPSDPSPLCVFDAHPLARTIDPMDLWAVTVRVIPGGTRERLPQSQRARENALSRCWRVTRCLLCLLGCSTRYHRIDSYLES